MPPSQDNLVSVVMPAYNAESTVTEAIDSVLAQTHGNLELIVVDDGSSDSTPDLVTQITDKRLVFLQHPANLGQGIARNTAISASTGDWITLIDADDLWTEDRLELLLRIAGNDRRDVMVADNISEFYTTRDGMRQWRSIWDKQLRFENGIAELSLARYLASKSLTIQPLFPRRAVVENGLKYSDERNSEDIEFYIRLMNVAGLPLIVTSYKGYLYRHTPGSARTNEGRHMTSRAMFSNLLATLELDSEEKQAFERRLARLDQLMEYSDFLAQLKRGRLLRALGMCFTRPWYLLHFLRKIPDTISYRMQLLLHGGSRR